VAATVAEISRLQKSTTGTAFTPRASNAAVMEERIDTGERSPDGKRYFIIRQEYAVPAIRSKLCEEIKLGNICQGWGVTGSDLRGPLNDWVESFSKAFGGTRAEAESRFKILKRLLEIQNGDRVIVPKQPDDLHFLVGDALKYSSNLAASEQHGNAR
jgi:hypothetical protein